MENPLLPYVALVGGVLLLFVVLADTFETIVLPRGVARGTGLTRTYYKAAWSAWRQVGDRLPEEVQERFLVAFGPLSLLFLLAIWATALILGFACLQWGVAALTAHARGFSWEAYMSGTTFFTLGLGDVTAGTPAGRFLLVLEAGVGFGFLAIVIGYFPVLYGAFSRREANISLLDSRASSPPTAGELLCRFSEAKAMDKLENLLAHWEAWCSELMESHLSYPVLAYYRSQHDRQSWLAAIAAILDSCALIRVGLKDGPEWQAQLTFAMARHALVDLTMVLGTKPIPVTEPRLTPSGFEELTQRLAKAGVPLREREGAAVELNRLRSAYEPYLFALSKHLKFVLPPWFPETESIDDWQTTAWKDSGHF